VVYVVPRSNVWVLVPSQWFYVRSPKNIKLILLVTKMNYLSIVQEQKECTELPHKKDQGSTTTIPTNKAEKTYRNIILKDLHINHSSLLL
jgi:hypothetical protein